MIGKFRYWRWLVGAAALVAVECAGVAAVELALMAPAHAQWTDNRYPFLSRQRPQRSGNYFQNWFGPNNGRPFEGEPAQQHTDYSRAPSPHKPDTKAEPVVPTISIVVMGDGMADWLAYGLEDAFSDSPEIGVVRKNKPHSGLLRYEAKSELDWWHVARDILAQEKANYVVMMLGVGDRQNFREKDLAKEAEQNEQNKAKDEQNKTDADKSTQNKDQSGNPGQPAIIAPESQPTKKANGIIEFRSDQWAQVYSRRIDATVAALKSKGVPVFWVGLPSIRGPKSTADAVYLNDLYRARAERAGAIYVDVWDGFVDEAGKYATYGPDYEGQMRRLRSGDGVYFTKAGARKLAHYIERELRRYMSSHATPVALPAGPVGPVPATGKSAVRPLAGPVVPLTVTPGNSDELLGGAGIHPAHSDAIANRVLVKGEPVPAPAGRADDFVWSHGNDAKTELPAGVPAAAASAAVPAANAPARTEPPAATAKKPAERKSGTAAKTTQNTAEKPKLVEPDEKKPPQHTAPRPPRPFSRSGDPFGWMR
jgi:hypothetical protein